jgi:large subunit ribosomal protein L21
MYAVIESGGKQHRVQVGEVIKVERIDGDVGASVVFSHVLAFSDKDDRMQLGAPTLTAIQVRGTVVEQGRGAKILLYTYKRRQNSNRRSQGHRQAYTAVKIDAIEG